jgi:hypothetical protein
MTGPHCSKADTRFCGHCGAATDQETPVEVAEIAAVPVTEPSDQVSPGKPSASPFADAGALRWMKAADPNGVTDGEISGIAQANVGWAMTP